AIRPSARSAHEAASPHERGDMRDAASCVPDVTSAFALRATTDRSSYGGQVAVGATLPAQCEPIVKIPSAPICTSPIRSLRTEWCQMQNKDERQSWACQQIGPHERSDVRAFTILQNRPRTSLHSSGPSFRNHGKWEYCEVASF